jgi:hypothetical protein
LNLKKWKDLNKINDGENWWYNIFKELKNLTLIKNACVFDHDKFLNLAYLTSDP